MDKSVIKEILAKEGYPDFMIESTMEKIEKFAPAVANAFSEWLDKGIEPYLEVGDYSYTVLIQAYKMKPIGAFITLDWLYREPDQAKKALKRGIK
ncbi:MULTISPECIES: hypothetical protein [Bacteroides]|uniref:hypothetical protein n=1 Tax=Bacteroides TaxID=816 RepID=UPI00033AA720|nr:MULTISPECIES: hypothetical protein [Bacteroides]MBM6945439.1 hypothetical protein [Bacteroides gallinaceum]OUO55917.1 hypothetical protein B5F78_10155 [Bacteroides sp. An279]CCZ69759.1 putative uncharacterized protein [Bacteroides sp. CAG:702]